MAGAIGQRTYYYPTAPAMANHDYGRATIFSRTGTLFHFQGGPHQMTYFEPNVKIEFEPRRLTLRQWLLKHTVWRFERKYNGETVKMHTPLISLFLREMMHSMLEMHASGFVTVRDWELDDFILVSGIPKLTVGIQHFSVEQNLTQTVQINRDYLRFADVVYELFYVPNVEEVILPVDILNLLDLLVDPHETCKSYVLKRHAAILPVDERLDFWRRITETRVPRRVNGKLETIVNKLFPQWWKRIPKGSDFEEFLYYGRDFPNGSVPDNTILGEDREDLITCSKNGMGLIRFLRNIVVHIYLDVHRRNIDPGHLDEWISTIFPGLMSSIQDSLRDPFVLNHIQS